MKPRKQPLWLDREKCYIGDSPSGSQTSTRAAGAMSYLRDWIAGYSGFMFSGPPISNVNPDSGTFYVINHGQPLPSAKDRKVYVSYAWWDTGQVEEYTRFLYWYPSYLTQTEAARITLYSASISTPTAIDWYDKDVMPIIYGRGVDNSGDTVDIEYTPAASGAFVCSALVFQRARCAALTVCERPWQQVDVNDVIVDESDVGVGVVARGYTGTGQPSIGEVIQYTGDPSWDNPGDATQLTTIDRATQRCLFQTGHPAGRYTAQTDYNNIFGEFFSPKIRLRDIYNFSASDNADREIFPAVVVSGNGSIRFTITTDTDTYTSTYTHASATVTLVQPSSFTGTLKAELGEDNTVTVEAKVTTGGDEFIVHTVSLWEGSQSYE